MTLPNKHTKNVRLIARLDVKGPNLIKGIHLEGLRVIGDPAEHAQRYYEQGADEIIYLDIVASLYGRSNLKDIVQQTANDIFIPLTVGGGIRTIADVDALLKAGADKVAINTAGVRNPDLLTEVANTYGSQCLVLSIEAKRNGNSWEVYTDCGRESTGLDAIEWAIRGRRAWCRRGPRDIDRPGGHPQGIRQRADQRRRGCRRGAGHRLWWIWRQ